MSQQNNKIAKATITIIICLILTGLFYLAVLNKQLIIDQITVLQYKPSSEVVSLADNTGLGSYGIFLFMASQPMLAKTAGEVKTFNSVCSDIERTTSILGCYSNYRIYLYDVTDAQLDGVKETTAAHETLHAAYLRMNKDEKNAVDVLLEAEAKKLETNKDFAERMAYYDRNEPGQRDNELHSVIGTEIAIISPELETYYKKYFSDRQKVVTLNAKYISVFQELTAKADALLAQLNALSENISTSSSQYNADTKSLNADIAAFNSQASNGSFKSQSEFNSQRAALSARVVALGQYRGTINGNMSKYDTILAEYNSIASQSKKLSNSLDSTLAPAPSV